MFLLFKTKNKTITLFTWVQDEGKRSPKQFLKYVLLCVSSASIFEIIENFGGKYQFLKKRRN